MPFGFPLRTRITNGVLLTIPFCGNACQSEVTKPPCLSLCASRSIERIAIWAFTPCRIWLVTVSDPVKAGSLIDYSFQVPGLATGSIAYFRDLGNGILFA